MRRIFRLLLIVTVVVGFAFGAQAQNGSSVLVLDVYSVKVPSDVVQEKGFALWAKSLKASGESSHEHAPVIHAIYRLGAAVNIDKHYRTGEGSEEQISVVGRVEPEQRGVEYKVEFSELGRPPAYDGKTALTIGPREKRVLVLPAVELGVGERLQTVVTLQYRVEDKENGLKSRFEIK
jgi:hypothetical protein